MRTKKGLFIVIFFVIIALALQFALKTKQGGLNAEQVQITNEKTYEQGLWDGFNQTMKYLDKKGYLRDTVKVEITTLDSMLHAK
jgi:hypothetical protein